MDCLDEETILSFCRGGLPEHVRARAQEHISTCDECRQLISAVARSSVVDPAERGDFTEPNADRESDPNAAEPRPFLRGRLDPAMAATTPIGSSGPTPPVSPVKPGEILAGKFQVERVLGAGGMGVVVAARHTQLDQRVALKFLLPVACEVPGAVARFLREGKAAASITSEHVARVMDTGVLTGGAPYLVMEYLEGSDLGVLVQKRGRIPHEEAIDYVLQACEAIVEAHGLGIVHRDLKPANLFLSHRADGSPLVKVLDFGISKLAGAGSRSQLTSASVLMGSPRYMSPEQMMSAKDVDARTDVWALGVILYELVTGQAVWHADTMQGLCALIASAPAPRLRETLPDAPPVLEDVISRCLAKAVHDRIASVADLAQALLPIAPQSARTSIDRILRVGRRDRSVSSGPRSGGAVRVPSALTSPQAPPASAVPAVPASAQTGGGAVAVVATAPDARSGGGRLGMVLGIGVAILLVAGIVINASLARRGAPPAVTSAAPPEGAAAPAPPPPSAAPALTAETSATVPAPVVAPPPSATVAATAKRAPRAPVASAVAPPLATAASPSKPAETHAPSPAPTPSGTNRALSDRK